MKEYDVGEYRENNHVFTIGRGFGYDKMKDGSFKYKKHDYKVLIGNDVFIGNGTNIDIGRHRHTVISDGCKLDSHIHVGHNVFLGENVIICAGAILGGSCEIGSDSYLSIGCIIRDNIKIGANCFVGMGAVVTKSVPDNTVVMGIPAKPIGKRSEYVERYSKK